MTAIEQRPPWAFVSGPAGKLLTYTTGQASGGGQPVLVLCHELPRNRGAAADAGPMYPALADRLASECGLAVATAMLRGVGGSEGEFSAQGWLEDLGCFVDHEVGDDGKALLVGFGLGANVALRLGANDPRVSGVAAIASAADFSDGPTDPELLVAQCRSAGVIADPGFPIDNSAWWDELVALRPLEAVGALGTRPLLVIHGSDDRSVPASWAQTLARAARGPVDLRVVPGGGHWLRADPRVVATLIGWTERQRHRSG